MAAVADRASRFAAEFGGAEWGRAAGLLHDAGKLRRAFQRYIKEEGPHAGHTAYGIYLAEQEYGPALGRVLGYVVAGHHGGLPDGGEEYARRLSEGAAVDDAVPWPSTLALPRGLRPPPGMGGLSKTERVLNLSFFVRMLFSALVDADFLCTEAFYRPARNTLRAPEPAMDAAVLSERLNAYLDTMGATAALNARGARERDVMRLRGDILAWCRTAAQEPPGVFSLTVPTGGGKTLSSLAFALDHAKRHGLRRVVYVIPFTSIIEQTADVFRHALGDFGDVVLEHHSAAPPMRGEEPMGPDRLRLAEENWDAPIVVTTTVQLFDSLYANRPAACRKLHNLAQSVIVLDEVQALPAGHLAPCLAALRSLTELCGSTVVLCTATQPDLSRGAMAQGFDKVHEIVPDPPSLYRALCRVGVEKAGPMDDGALVDALAAEAQVLCIVDARRHAADLFRALVDRVEDGVFHLSAQMAPVHRRGVLQRVRRRLEAGEPCRLISTQVVEAGVDVDFPVVFRSAAGIDSLAQAAGRCNRNGRLPALGRVVVFDAEAPSGLAELKRRRDLAAPMVEAADDPLDLDTVDAYFARLFAIENTDKAGVLRATTEAGGRGVFPFRAIAEAFRLIDQPTQPVVVPVGEAEALVADLRRRAEQGLPPTRDLLRGLQQVSVSVYPNVLVALEEAGGLSRFGPDGRFLELVEPDFYDGCLGLVAPVGCRAGDGYIV